MGVLGSNLGAFAPQSHAVQTANISADGITLRWYCFWKNKFSKSRTILFENVDNVDIVEYIGLQIDNDLNFTSHLG